MEKRTTTKATNRKTKIDLRHLSKKQQKQGRVYLRAAIQLIFFLFWPSAFTAAFSGIKYIFTQVGAGDQIELSAFITVLITLCLFTMVFGRFFCGFACAFGSFGDAVRAIYLAVCKKSRRKAFTIKPELAHWLTYLKFVVLAAIAVMCFAGVYSNLQGTSPWDVFSMLHALNFKLGGYIPGLIILLLLIVGMCVQERFFCRFLCPMGAIFSLLPILPVFTLSRDRDNCIRNCRACTRKCPAGIELPATGAVEVTGECFQCQKCIDTCPKGNIHTQAPKVKDYVLKGNEVIFTLIRFAILLGLFLWLGI